MTHIQIILILASSLHVTHMLYIHVNLISKLVQVRKDKFRIINYFIHILPNVTCTYYDRQCHVSYICSFGRAIQVNTLSTYIWILKIASLCCSSPTYVQVSNDTHVSELKHAYILKSNN